ncbi:FkbM family methyltransferase [Rhodopirellula halodulae]|uniref:FkbM family methyltransferase n=1 Tax=Rhodopirellula halodulae TaxID=2894198 RepID=UPI001E5C219A|nr:FkbM family methyltransferase [Rhodopirellula sp. JC737]MCC9656896.1 FkbM family methyltransferase [Rhodopirellula sp. JC737]
MSNQLKQLKQTWRLCGSVANAFKGKVRTALGIRKPTKTCQIPELKHIVDETFLEKQDRVFVEVGAYDGERFSNTSWLADAGWRGLYVEPSKQFSRWCRLRHMLNRVTVLNVAAGSEDAKATLQQIGSLSTMSQATFEEYDRITWAKQQVAKECKQQQTEVLRLDRILADQKIPRSFDILVVDVEGYEENVFSGFSLSQWKPKLIIVELCDIHPDFQDNRELVESARRVRQTILDAGYREKYADSINTVFEVEETSASVTATNNRIAA